MLSFNSIVRIGIMSVLFFQFVYPVISQDTIKLFFSGRDRIDASKQFVYGSDAKDSTSFKPLYERYFLKPQNKVLESGPPVFSPDRDKFVRYENGGTEWRMIIRFSTDGSLYQNIPPTISRESCPQWMNDNARIFYQKEKVDKSTYFYSINISESTPTFKILGLGHNQYYSTTFGQSPSFLSKYDSIIFFTTVSTAPNSTIVPAYYDTEKQSELLLLTPESACTLDGSIVPRSVFSSLREPNSTAVNTHISVSQVDKKIVVAGHIRLDKDNDKVYEETRMGLFLFDYSDNPVSIKQLYTPVKGPYSDWPSSYHISPDGQKVVFVVDMGLNDFRIYISDVKTLVTNELVKGSLLQPYPWSSDAKKLVYFNNKTFWTINSDGTELTQVASSKIGDTLNISDVQWIDFNTVDGNAIQQVEIVDPSPDLIKDRKITSDEDLLAKSGRIVIGLVADGNARILVRAKTQKPGKVTFSIKDFIGLTGDKEEDGGFSSTNSEDPQNEIVINTVSVGNENWAFAIFHSPVDFTRTKISSIDFNAKTRKTGIKVFNETTEKKIDIIIHRPPLVFIHGLWSSRSCWDDFYPVASPKGSLDNRFTSYFGDYSGSNDREILYNTSKMCDSVISFIKDYKTKNRIACTGADLIVHSMGGLISRAMSVYTDYKYFSDENFGKGYIHKLITMNTPHNGAEICDFLWSARMNIRSRFWARTVLSAAIAWFGGSASYDGIAKGAVYDMIPNSSTMALLNRPENVKNEATCHRFACDASGAAKSLFGSLIVPIQLTMMKPPVGLDGIYGTLFHDICVTRVSQMGTGISDFSSSSETLREYYTHFALGWLNSALSKNSDHGYLVIELLNSKRNSDKFSLNGKNVFKENINLPLSNNENIPEYSKAKNEQEILIKDSLIKISSPAAGTEINPGSEITVNINSDNGAAIKKLWLTYPGYVEIDSSSPFTFKMPVPVNAPSGKFKYFVFAEDDKGNIFYDKTDNLLFAESYLNITNTKTIIDFLCDVNERTVLKSTQTRLPARLMGLTTDSIWIDLSTDKNIVVNIIDSAICQYQERHLAALKEGFTKIIFSYGSFSDSLEVEVDLSYQHPDANAGEDQYVNIGTNVILNSLGSLFQNNIKINYTWTLINKPANSKSILAGVALSKASIVPDAPGVYSVILKIEDDAGNSSLSKVNVFASSPDNIIDIASEDMEVIKVSGSLLKISNSNDLTTINSVKIYDLIGNLVMSLHGGQLQSTYDLSGLSDDIYLIVINTNSGKIIRRIFYIVD